MPIYKKSGYTQPDKPANPIPPSQRTRVTDERPGWPAWIGAKGCDVEGTRAGEHRPGAFYVECRACGKRTYVIDMPPGCTVDAPPPLCPTCRTTGDPTLDAGLAAVEFAVDRIFGAVGSLVEALTDPQRRAQLVLHGVGAGLEEIAEDMRHPTRWPGLAERVRQLQALVRFGIEGAP